MEIDQVGRLAGGLSGVRAAAREGLAEWRYHGRLVARQLDDERVDLAAGDAGAIEDALEKAWELQRDAN